MIYNTETINELINKGVNGDTNLLTKRFNSIITKMNEISEVNKLTNNSDLNTTIESISFNDKNESVLIKCGFAITLRNNKLRRFNIIIDGSSDSVFGDIIDNNLIRETILLPVTTLYEPTLKNANKLLKSINYEEN